MEIDVITDAWLESVGFTLRHSNGLSYLGISFKVENAECRLEKNEKNEWFIAHDMDFYGKKTRFATEVPTPQSKDELYKLCAAHKILQYPKAIERIAVCQLWEESEAGWGCRPDGYSLHLNAALAKNYAENYMKKQKKYFEDQGIKVTPIEYTRPSGEPYSVYVDEDTYQQLLNEENIACSGSNYPKKVQW